MSEMEIPVAPTGPHPALSRDERRIRAAQDVLRTAIRDLYLGHFGAHVPQESIPVRLAMQVHPSDQWRLEFEPPLMEQLLPQLADREAAREVFQPGHVYCFRCSSSDCEHARPPSPRHVFKGYDSTGRPEWQELVQALIDEKDERVDQLFGHPPRLVARFQYGRTLKGQQLSAFGKASLSYSILAQVIAGYFDCEGERLAVSLQIVEGRDRHGDLVLRLNPVGHALDGSFLVAWLSAEKSAVLFRAIQIAERDLAGIEQLARAAREAGDQDRVNQMMGRIPGVGRRLLEALERGGRQGERRTRHVEARRQDQRPVHKARDDAAAARPERCYRDEKADTFVVMGDRGRAHAFNAEGRHVTSFLMKAGAVDFRLRTERWRAITADEWTDLRKALQSVGESRNGEKDHAG